MYVRALAAFFGALFCIVWTGSSMAELSATKKIELQAAMQRHIETHLVDGVFLHFEPETGALRRYRMSSPHPQIVQVGEYFVLCADFRDESGGVVNFDFFIALGSRGPVVFQTAIDDPVPLVNFMRAKN